MKLRHLQGKLARSKVRASLLKSVTNKEETQLLRCYFVESSFVGIVPTLSHFSWKEFFWEILTAVSTVFRYSLLRGFDYKPHKKHTDYCSTELREQETSNIQRNSFK